MTLDEQAQQVYAGLDDGALLSLLVVLNGERNRHMETLGTLGKMYRDVAGADAPAPTSFVDMFERIQAAAIESGEDRDLLELAQQFLHGHFDRTGEDPADPALWQQFTVGYSMDLADRGYWVRNELARRHLIPRPDMDPAYPGPLPGADGDTDPAAP